MSDLISRQAAIDAAVEAADEWDGGYSRSRQEIITMKLRMLPSSQPHWIPCSDRLPKKEQECLVCRNGIIRIDKFIGRDIPYKWNLTISDYEAWMPLPDPYKGEQNE